MRINPTKFHRLTALAFAASCLLFTAGCRNHPSRVEPDTEVARPEQILDFPTLYKQNCAACHGANGKNGASLPLANPVYLALAGQQIIANTIAHGVSGRLMPPFAKSAGGMLTDQQVNVLAQGIVSTWSTPNLLASANPPPYTATLRGDAAHGQQAFTSFCASCHGANGQGAPGDAKGAGKLGSLIDPAYLTLVSDQYLRTLTIAGMPDRGMPDWRSDAQQPLTDQQITDIVAWLTSQRTADPGQPYPTPQPHP
jgi:cytochrome c oxidase cbb3-type subunit 3/ubiquinol-cytochrome c reductase cytochrome c subunit